MKKNNVFKLISITFISVVASLVPNLFAFAKTPPTAKDPSTKSKNEITYKTEKNYLENLLLENKTSYKQDKSYFDEKPNFEKSYKNEKAYLEGLIKSSKSHKNSPGYLNYTKAKAEKSYKDFKAYLNTDGKSVFTPSKKN